jgi:hypothetical protein
MSDTTVIYRPRRKVGQMSTTRPTRQMNAPRPAGVDGGTEVRMVHEGIPDKIPPAGNETGTRMALDSLARLVEAG